MLGQHLNWKDPHVLNLGEADERLLRNVLDNREVSCSREVDEIIWCGAKSGSYSVKLGYTLLEIEGRTKEWESKLCWNKECLPKAGAFSWLVGNKRIQSGDRLKKMGFASPFRCVLYEKEEEDVDHLLLNCEFAQEAWRFELQRLNWKGPKARNLLFEDKAENTDHFLIILEKAILELVTNAASQVNLAKAPFIQFDAGVLVNFDGTSRGNLGVSGVGVIAQDECGNTLAIGAKRLVDGLNNKAECQAAIEAILMAKNLGVKKLHLEGDSQIVVNGIGRGHMKAWQLDKHIRRMKLLLYGFEDFKVSHVLKEANVEADKLSNVGANGSLDSNINLFEDLRNVLDEVEWQDGGRFLFVD
ncbi:uncharacterized protein LOC131858386 [Cryptomeria japonica]|uniref:uncharacterized protein LOC131858386 n=1 Tax=Cryptomeria japonica TaxID=3369 RepID=UPI0027D9DBE7|nr:uncharacterized protein LOC131858386 [Cryptomeria japonica]